VRATKKQRCTRQVSREVSARCNSCLGLGGWGEQWRSRFWRVIGQGQGQRGTTERAWAADGVGGAMGKVNPAEEGSCQDSAGEELKPMHENQG
jgi:hypothetical protein